MTFVFNRLRSGGVLAMSIAALVVTLLPSRPQAQAPGQTPAAEATPPPINQSSDPLLASFRFRSIGPASMGGRIDDIAVSESDPNVIYVGYAVGGVWSSTPARGHGSCWPSPDW